MEYQTAREIALKRDRVCQNCGAEKNLHAHHIIPRKEDGPDTPENLVILCQHCHPKYEGTQKRPRLAGGGYKVSDIVKRETLDTLLRITPDFVRYEEPFKSVQRDPGVCTNCFRRMWFEENYDRKKEFVLAWVVSMSAFEDVRQDPDICSNCFRRMRNRYERNYRLEPVRKDGEWEMIPVDVQGLTITVDGEEEEIGGFDDDVYRNPETTTKIPERGAHRGMRTVCDCGYRHRSDGDWKNRPLDKRTFFEYAERLADRFEEKGVGFDREEFFERLDTLKSDPDEQFADDRMFLKAIDHASAVETVRSTT